MARPLSCGTTLSSRGLTDIEYYQLVEKSHLHLKPAQSTLRQFLLKLSAQRAHEENARAEERAGADEGEEEGARGTVGLHNYVERSPSEVLR